MTPKDDLLSWHGFLTVVATLGTIGIGALIAWLFRDAHHRGYEATSAAVTTRTTDYVERPETDGGWPWFCIAGCGHAVLLDHTTGLPETCRPCARVLAAYEAELGGAA